MKDTIQMEEPIILEKHFQVMHSGNIEQILIRPGDKVKDLRRKKMEMHRFVTILK